MKDKKGFILLEIMIGFTISLVVAEATAKLLSSLSKSSAHFALPQQLEKVKEVPARCTAISSEETKLLCSTGELRWYLFS